MVLNTAAGPSRVCAMVGAAFKAWAGAATSAKDARGQGKEARRSRISAQRPHPGSKMRRGWELQHSRRQAWAEQCEHRADATCRLGRGGRGGSACGLDRRPVGLCCCCCPEPWCCMEFWWCMAATAPLQMELPSPAGDGPGGLPFAPPGTGGYDVGLHPACPSAAWMAKVWVQDQGRLDQQHAHPQKQGPQACFLLLLVSVACRQAFLQMQVPSQN